MAEYKHSVEYKIHELIILCVILIVFGFVQGLAWCWVHETWRSIPIKEGMHDELLIVKFEGDWFNVSAPIIKYRKYMKSIGEGGKS